MEDKTAMTKNETIEICMGKEDEMIKVVPIDDPSAIYGDRSYEQMPLSSLEKMQFSSLLSQVPSALAASSMSGMYRVVFPDGLQHSLTALKQGGFSSYFKDANGKFAGSASLYKSSFQAAALGVFTVMSIVCGQYFLAEINKEMTLINQKIDKIIEFLYGDKKAELLAEISFTRYAFENYRSIMAHPEQRIATITSLQEAKKIAIKDIEFFINDLDTLSNIVTKSAIEFDDNLQKAFRAHDSLMLSSQLLTMSSILEVFFSQNIDQNYLAYIEDSNAAYLEKCDKLALSSLSTLKFRVLDPSLKVPAKMDFHKQHKAAEITKRMEQANNDKNTESRKRIHSVFESMRNMNEIAVDSSGNAYIKKIL